MIRLPHWRHQVLERPTPHMGNLRPVPKDGGLLRSHGGPTGQAICDRGVGHGGTSEVWVTSMRHGKRIPSRHETVAADPSVSRGLQHTPSRQRVFAVLAEVELWTAPSLRPPSGLLMAEVGRASRSTGRLCTSARRRPTSKGGCDGSTVGCLRKLGHGGVTSMGAYSTPPDRVADRRARHAPRASHGPHCWHSDWDGPRLPGAPGMDTYGQ